MAAFIHQPRSVLRHFLATCAAGLSLLAWAPAASAQEGWAVCASEGQTCNVSGDTMVRYGTDGKFAFRNTNVPLVCSPESFGVDPVPGRRKQCEVSTSWRSESRYRWWRDSGQQPVGVGRGTDQPAASWRACATEGGLCEFAGTATVRYGANGRYAERNARGSIGCNNAQFGDPVPGLAKQCEYKTAGASVIDTGVTSLTWDACASEGGQCNFRGAAMVRYGVTGRYTYREATNGLACGVDAFGGDPAVGTVKQCEVLRLRR